MIKIGTALSIVGGIAMAIVSFTAAFVVTRPQLNAVRDTVAIVNDKVDTLQSRTEARFRQIEGRQAQADSVRALLIPMARLQCLQLQRWESSTLGAAAGLPCDSLLRRIR